MAKAIGGQVILELSFREAKSLLDTLSSMLTGKPEWVLDDVAHLYVTLQELMVKA